MAGAGEEETEYESDPEEAKISLKMRRREASDDEEDEREEEGEEKPTVVDSDAESDGQGGAADYDEEYVEEEEYYDEEVVEEREIVVVAEEMDGGDGGGGRAKEMAENCEKDQQGEEEEGEGEEKKENEPFAVPTSGAFYMHDDRFRDNAGGKNRRTFGGRKLWESKDVRKWGHDKFEEMNVHDKHSEEGRMLSKGYNRGRGRGRGAERGYARGNRMRGYGGSNNQNAVSMDVKGRGPRRYQPLMKNKSEVLPPQNKQSAKFLDKTLYTGSVRVATSTTNPNENQESVPAKKVASNLNSASPPFYPSGSSKNEVIMTQKKETQAGHNRNIRPSSMDRSFPITHSNAVSRGKNVIGSVGMDNRHIDDSVSPATAKPLNNLHLLSSASPPLSATPMPPPTRGDDCRGIAVSAVFQPSQTNNQVKKVHTEATEAPQRNPVPNRAQPSLQPSVQYLAQRPLGASQGSSPPKAGKGTIQGAGTGSLVYGGGQVMGSGGNRVAGHGDKNLPAFFPVMQFGGQHPRGVGVPAVGMAFPGYVAQPNSLGNSEMTWLPVLASAAGALGASYCPPYIVDGINHPRPTGQTSDLPAPSKDNHPSKPNNELNPQQRSEVANQRQNKPRRYSEMSFSQ